MRVEAISPALPALLAWSGEDPEARMQTASIEAFQAGFEAAGKSADPIPVAPSIALLAPSTRQRLIQGYREIEACERDELHRPQEAANARRRIAALEREGDISLAEMLEAV